MAEKRTKFIHIAVRWGGLAIMAFAGYLFVSNGIFWVRAEPATGNVIAQEVSVGASSTARTVNERVQADKVRAKSFAPQIAFKTADNEEVTFLSNVGYDEILAFDTGDKVPVLYLSSDPQSAKVYSFFEMFGLPIILFLFGGVFWLIGVFIKIMNEPSDNTRNGRRPTR